MRYLHSSCKDLSSCTKNLNPYNDTEGIKDDSFETSFNNGLSSGEGDNEDNEEDDEPWNFVNDDRLARFIIQNAEYDSSFYATISDCKNNIYSRWFPTYPRKSFDLCRFLLHWLSRGAHCVMTLNNVGKTQSNSNWFHYCVYAVNETKIIFYPHLVCTEKEIKEHLSSSPNIIISRDLILKFWTPNSNIQALVNYPSEEWKTYNVLGQLVNLLREEVIWNDSVSTNIKVPSSCSPGITVLINMENPYLKELKEFPELPSDVDNFCASLIIGECR